MHEEVIRSHCFQNDALAWQRFGKFINSQQLWLQLICWFENVDNVDNTVQNNRDEKQN